MKTATNIYDTVKARCEGIPFAEIKFGNIAHIKQYWTKRPGHEGHQVYTIVHHYPNNKDTEVLLDVTGGGGYCKESQGYWQALRAIGHRTRKDKSPCSSGVDYSYHVGGNYYRVPQSEIRKYK